MGDGHGRPSSAVCGAAGQGDIIRFDEPMTALSASGFSTSGEQPQLRKAVPGHGTLTGTKYIHNMRDIVRTVSRYRG